MSDSDEMDNNRDAGRLECISALVDGRLHDEDFALAAEAAIQETEARAAWQAYHMVGDVLRLGESALQGRDGGFAARFTVRLSREAPPARATAFAQELAAVAAQDASAFGKPQPAERAPDRGEAANSPVFRWKIAAGLAVAVAVGAVGWSRFDAAPAPGGQPAQFANARSLPARGGNAVRAEAPQLAGAAASTTVLARDGSPPMMRDARLDELLAAHEQLSGASALQTPAGLLRNAVFESRGR